MANNKDTNRKKIYLLLVFGALVLAVAIGLAVILLLNVFTPKSVETSNWKQQTTSSGLVKFHVPPEAKLTTRENKGTDALTGKPFHNVDTTAELKGGFILEVKESLGGNSDTSTPRDSITKIETLQINNENVYIVRDLTNSKLILSPCLDNEYCRLKTNGNDSYATIYVWKNISQPSSKTRSRVDGGVGMANPSGPFKNSDSYMPTLLSILRSVQY